MVKQESVNVTAQMIMGLIPIVSLFAFYRIQKLRKYVAISILFNMVVAFGILGVSYGMTIMSDTQELDFTDTMLIIINMMEEVNFNFISIGIGIMISIYFMRRWAKQWNQQYPGE